MKISLSKRAVIFCTVLTILGATFVAIPAEASSPKVSSTATIFDVLGSSGVGDGHAANWDSNSSAPIISTNNGMTVSLPAHASGEVTLSSNGRTFGMGIPYGANASSAQSVDHATTVYSGGAPDVTIAAQADSTGAREAMVITGATAPKTYVFPLTLPVGASLVANPDHSYTILEQVTSGVAVQLGTIDAPWAKDASGNAVPTDFSLQGNSLVQTVRFTNSATFPVVADPHIDWGWVTGTMYFNKTETKVAATVAGFQTFLDVVYLFLIGTGIGSIAAAIIYVSEASIAYTAASAWASGRCLYIRGGLQLPPVTWDTYSGGYCT